MVTHDGARWLPETLQAVRDQSRPVQRVVAVDTGSRDRSGAILAQHISSDAIITQPRATGYGDAVQAALASPRARTEFPSAADGVEWIWLIHDDCTPEPETLHHLLRAADEDPRAAIFGPKLRDWFDRRLLVEAGVTIDGAGRRETGLEPREFDQGQHDGTQQVLAVSSAGMLVRRDVWEALNGFDPGLALFRDDIDFCWRAGGAGHRVLIVPDAVAYHCEAAARRRRRISATSDHPRRVDRRNAMFVLLANLPFAAMLGALLRNTVASFFRVLLYVVAKQPANAFDEFAAITSVYLMPFRLVRARFRRRRNRRRTYSAIQPFMARGVAARQFMEMGASLLSGSGPLDTPGRHQAVTTAPDTGEDDDPLHDESGLLRRILTHPGVLLVLALTVVSLIAERSLMGGGRLAGGALVPVWGGASDLWALYLAGWHDVGVGSSAAAPPYVGMLAILSTLAFGKPWLAVTVILLGCVPLAGFTAYLLARKVLRYRPAQLWMAASYALLPVATGAVAQGRLGSALVHALFPVLALLATRVLVQPRRQSRRAAWALALFLSLAMAFVPLVWALALLTGLLIALAFGSSRPGLYTSIAIALGVPLLLLMPWTLKLFTHPAMWLLEAGLHRPDISDPDLPARALLLLSPGGPGVPPVWVTAGFLAAALCSLLLRKRRLLVAVGWSMALFGILVAILVSRITLAPPQGGQIAAAWPGVALAFAATAVLLSAATAAQSFDDLLRLGGLRRLFALGIALLAITTPLLSAADWMWNGVSGPLTAHGEHTYPQYLEALSADGTQPRTLAVAPGDGGSVEYSVLRGREPRIGEAKIPADKAVSDRLDRVVAATAAGRGGDEAAKLAGFGIRYVLLPASGPGGEVNADYVNRLDATPGLRRLTLSDEFGLWRITEPSGRLRIVDSDPGTEPVVLDSGVDSATVHVPQGDAPRSLVLAEPADDAWQATLDGSELETVEAAQGMQTFQLPSQGGELEISHNGFARQIWVSVQIAIFIVIVVMALPGARSEEDDGRESAAAGPHPDTPQPKPTRPRREQGTRRAARSGHRGHRARSGLRRGDRSPGPRADGAADRGGAGSWDEEVNS